jgi:MerC mercury resistance protein
MLYHYAKMKTFGNPQPVKSDAMLKGSAVDVSETAAMVASLICLVHCLALPLLVAALPLISGSLVTSEIFHVVILAFAIPVSGIALIAGYHRHGAWGPPVIGGIGLLSLIAGVSFTDGGWSETAFTVAGSLLLATAHIANWRMRNAPARRHA